MIIKLNWILFVVEVSLKPNYDDDNIPISMQLQLIFMNDKM